MNAVDILMRSRDKNRRRNAAILLVLGVLLLATAIYSAAADSEILNWTRSDFSSTADLLDVAFDSPASGAAVGTGGAIARTHDGGVSWTTLETTATADLFGIDLAGDGSGWAVGAGGTVLASADGTSWNARESGVATDLLGVDFVDASNGWAVGRGATIISTVDGGSAWTTRTPSIPASTTLYGVSFVETSTGWTWGDNGTVLHTVDGGSTWSPVQAAPAGTSLFAGSFVDTQTGWVAGSGGLIMSTSDGGSTWTTQTAGTTADIRDITFVDAQHGFLVGAAGVSSGVIMATSDGGVTWTAHVPGVEAELNAVEFLDATRGWTVGSGGTILRSSTAVVPEADPQATEPPTAVYARAMRSGVVSVGWSETFGAVAPVTYRVWRSIDGGAFSSLAIVSRRDYIDEGVPALTDVAYRISTIDGRGEGVPSQPATVSTLAPPAPAAERPATMSCQGCHPPHARAVTVDYPTAGNGRCYKCHATDIGDRLSGDDSATRHDLLVSDQLSNGSRLECANCHDAHAASETTPSVDPDAPGPANGLARGSDDLCLRCHDTSLPGDAETAPWVSAPLAAGGGTSASNIAFSWGSASHGAGASTSPLLRTDMGYLPGDVLTCASCHDPHGSTNRWTLLESVSSSAETTRSGGLLVRPIPGGGADLRLFCAGCHSLTTHPAADLTQWPLDCTTCHSHTGGGL